MAKKADTERKMEKQAAATMESIEEAAQKKYQADQEAQAAISGRWTWDEASKYYYNAVHRWVRHSTPSRQLDGGKGPLSPAWPVSQTAARSLQAWEGSTCACSPASCTRPLVSSWTTCELHQLSVQHVLPAASPAKFQQWVSAAQAGISWLPAMHVMM
jgi:hypothetical protein